MDVGDEGDAPAQQPLAGALRAELHGADRHEEQREQRRQGDADEPLGYRPQQGRDGGAVRGRPPGHGSSTTTVPARRSWRGRRLWSNNAMSRPRNSGRTEAAEAKRGSAARRRVTRPPFRESTLMWTAIMPKVWP